MSTRWKRAASVTFMLVRNPTSLEFWLMNTVDWLRGHGGAPTAPRQWRDRLTGGEVSTE